MEIVEHLKTNYLGIISSALPSSPVTFWVLVLSYCPFVLLAVIYCFIVPATSYCLYLNCIATACLHWRTLLKLPTIDSFVILSLDYFFFSGKRSVTVFSKSKGDKTFPGMSQWNQDFINQGFNVEKKKQLYISGSQKHHFENFGSP